MKTLQIIKAYSISQICLSLLLLFLFVCFFFFRDSQICDLNKIPNYKVALYSRREGKWGIDVTP